MADSDGEDERFVKNVIHELSAFQVTEKPTGSESEGAPPESQPAEVPQDPPSNADQPQADAEPPKPPPRVIKLSRPVNPYGNTRTSQSSSVSAAPSINSSAPSGSAVPGPGAPGSRLAAMQRPGSPMQKFLQRSKSPALAAAAARLGQQTTPDTPAKTQSAANSSAANSSIANTETTASSRTGLSSSNKDATKSESSPSQTASLRASMPPRIPSSGLTSSILLRRPQSPLRMSRTGLLKQTSDPSEDGPSSPRSPASDTGNSVSSTEEAHAAEKEAIRNKLRANSFRLKDLLTKRPFVKSRDQGDSETKEESCTDQSAEHSDGHSATAGEDSRSSRDRTRWRTDGSSSSSSSSVVVSHRSRLSEKASSILSSRSTYARTKHNQESTDRSGDKTSVDSEQDLSGDVRNSEEMGLKLSIDSLRTKILDGSNNENPKPGSSESDAQRLSNKEPGNATVGATLLRSPRTRAVSVDSSVPSGVEHVTEQTDGHTDHANSAKTDRDLLDKRSKTLSDLEKDTEVNLVFDSVKMGQDEQNEENDASHDSRQSNMSKSMYSTPHSHTRGSRRPHVSSEPATPITEQNPLSNSQSFEKSLDADFLHSSPSLKRSFAVTDLDKAMYERDKQKLDSIFKGASQDKSEDNQEEKEEREKSSAGCQHSQLETDLDERHMAAHHLSRSPRIQHKLGSWSLEEGQTPPPTPPIHPVAPMVYKPNVNLEDAVKWPIDIPGKLDFKTMEVFEGQMLLNWLTSSVDKSHYLRLVMTKHDMNVIACQICTCLIAAGVMKQLESKEVESVFKTDCMYYWTHTQQQASHLQQDVSKLTPMWPPTQEETDTAKPGLKYTEAEHQAAMVKLRHEYNEEVDNLQSEQKGVLDRARDEYETRLQQSMERIVLLQKEVEKYKCLAGIEKLTQDALLDANAARVEAGMQGDGPQTNGFDTPLSHHPHSSALSPDGQYPPSQQNEKSPAELFPNLTTPAELRQDDSETSRSETSSVGEADPSVLVPPPPPPPAPGAPPPPAPPPPPTFGVHKSVSTKPIVSPMSPMKPLFWQRLQLLQLKTPKNKEYLDKKLVWEEIQEEVVDIKELDDLFSKTNMESTRRLFNRPKAKSKQPAKVISPKRSQTIGILLSSLRVEMSDIEDAILNFDTSLIAEEKLRHIYENRGDSDEMKKLKDYVKKHPDTPLDKPDQFLYDLSLVPDYAERIFCFIFQEAFQDSISVIDKKMTNLKMTCQTLITSLPVKRILGLVLALGNYMNGGNKQRGQADGFGIEILPKLKDVRSKDNTSSLLHYTVMQYVKKFEKQEAGTDRVKLPLPDPSDMKDACLVNFDELDKELKRIKKDFEAAEERAEKVISTAKEHHHLQPFKDIMTNFFERGRQEFMDQEENIIEGKKIFHDAVVLFCVKPKSGDKEVTPEFFFSTWCSFCQDFKDIWKREQQRVIKMRIKENEMRVKKMQESLAKKPVRTRTRKPGGLKDRLAKQGLLES